MLFLNMWLLLGVLGIAIPVIIHLLNRRHAKIIDWGAMRFLLDSLISRRRRVLLEEILLLAARCLIVGLVALALARPFVTESSRVPWVVVLPAGLMAVVLFGVSFALWRYPVWRRRVIMAVVVLAALAVGAVTSERWLNLKRFGGGGRDVALVLDGSSSMTMVVAGESNFARAIKEATTYIEKAPRGFAFSLIIGGSVPNILVAAPTPDRKHLLQQLQEAIPVQGTMQALDTLAVAATTLALGDNANKQVIMIGDGQSIGWKTHQPELWEYLREAFKKLPTPPQVVWRKLPMPPAIRNAGISAVAFSRQVIGTDRDVRIDVTVANTGGEAITPQEVRLVVGEKTLTDRSLGQLPPGASATASFMHRFQRAGTEVVKATVLANDELSGDDEAVRVVHVMERLGVLIVDAEPATRFLGRPGAFVSLALMPDRQGLNGGAAPAAGAAGSAVAPPEFLVRPDLISLSDLMGRAGPGDARVLVLVDVPQLPADMATRVANYVENGGGLLVIAGGRANASFYNGWRGAAGNVMPLALGALVEATDTNRPTLDLKSFSHAALKPLGASSDLGAAQFDRHWTAGPSRGDDGQVGGRFADGAPFVSERRYGRGYVLQVNAPMDSTAGTLVARQGFVPLAHELVYYLARPVAANLNLPPSRGATIQLAATRARVGGGLRAEYFDNPNRQQGGVVRVDPTITSSLSWPSARLPPADVGFWVLWTGSIGVPVTGTYRFERAAQSDITITINGHTIMEGAQAQAEVSFSKGQRYDLRVEFRCPPRAQSRLFRLNFSGPNLAPQPIPPEYLSPQVAAVREDGPAPGVDTSVQGPGKKALAARYVSGENGAMALRLEQNLVPGLYRAKVPAALSTELNRLLDGTGSLPFSVMVDGDESRLTPLSAAELTFIGKYVRFLVAGSAEDVMRALRGQAFGRELWRTLALAALALLLLEVLLTRWIAIQRRAGEEGQVTFEDVNKPSAGFREQLAAMQGRAAGNTGSGNR